MDSTRVFPDTAKCRTHHVHGEVYKCLRADGCRCPHAFAFAYSFYCRHPHGKDFIVRASWGLPLVA